MIDTCDCERCGECGHRIHESPRWGYWTGFLFPFMAALTACIWFRHWGYLDGFEYGLALGGLAVAMVIGAITDPHARWNR